MTGFAEVSTRYDLFSSRNGENDLQALDLNWLPETALGSGYSQYSNFSSVWFRLENASSSRYLHLGNVSLGCVTFGATSAGGTAAHKAEWTNLYNYLIKRRKSNGGNFVGQLIVQ